MSKITENTAALRELLSAVEELPDVGGGTPAPLLQTKTVIPTKSGQEVAADDGYDGLEKVTVAPIPDEYIIPSGTMEIGENGTYDVTGKSSVKVNIPTGTSEDLDAVLTAQETKLAQLSALLDSKAASGGSQKTCTVTYDDGGFWLWVNYVNANGDLGYRELENYESGFTITVPKGSTIMVTMGEYEGFSCTNATLISVANNGLGAYLATFTIEGDATIML